MKEKIKALLLSGGYGTRLRPITEVTPKCLVKINGKPMLEHWLSKLEEIECDTCIINTHYLSEKVNNFINNRSKSKMVIKEVYEKELLGTAGTLIKNSKIFRDSKILMIHTDNMTNFNLKELIQADTQRPKNCLMTMLTFQTESPSSSGIILKDKNNVLTEFMEKIKNPPSNIANAAIYLFDNNFINKIIEEAPNARDFSIDVIPKFLNRIYTFHTNENLIDIGTLANLNKANRLFSSNGN